MDFEYLSIEQKGDVAVLHVDRPPVNALDHQLLAEGAGILEELRAEPPPAVVITGREGCFCAGVDLKLAPTLDAEGQRRMVEGINRLFHDWYAFERPVVTAVNGHAIAGGFILALCGDARVAATTGRYGLTEVRAGIPYPGAAMAVVRAELAPPAARELVLGGELVGGARALELGAFDEVVAPSSVIPRALEYARKLAEIPPGAYAAVKRQLRGPALEEMAPALRGEDPLAGGWTSGETAAAVEGLLGGDSRVTAPHGDGGEPEYSIKPHPETGRPETDEMRVDRNLLELLNELRVALPGVQVLFAFLLIVPFSQGFPDVTAFQEKVYFGTLLFTAAAAIFLIAPSMHHRIEFRDQAKEFIVVVANRMAIIGLSLLAVAMVGVVTLITDLLYGPAATACAAAGACLMFALVWYAIPLQRKFRS